MGAMLVLLAVPVVSGSVNAIADFMIRHMPWTTRSTRIRSEEGECPACPASLAVPAFEGNMWVKWPRRIGVYDQEIESREATLNYANRMPDGRAWKWTWVMEAKWVLTSPRPQAPTCHSKGPLLITDLALICYPMHKAGTRFPRCLRYRPGGAGRGRLPQPPRRAEAGSAGAPRRDCTRGGGAVAGGWTDRRASPIAGRWTLTRKSTPRGFSARCRC